MSVTAPTISWAGLSPVIVILGAAVLGILLEAFVPRKARLACQTGLGVLAIVGSAVALAARWDAVRDGSGSALTPGFN